MVICPVCGRSMTNHSEHDFYDECKKIYRTFIIAGEQKPPEGQGQYVFWIDPATGEPLRPRWEQVCDNCGFAYDLYRWAPGGEPV